MVESILKIMPSYVIVKAANNEIFTIPVELTPKRRYLTQSTKRAISATGFLLYMGEDIGTDKGIINSALKSIEREVRRLRFGIER